MLLFVFQSIILYTHSFNPLLSLFFMIKNDCIIIGAGASGLSLAWFLTMRGLSVTVYESSPYVGGLSKSITVQFDHSSLILDCGPHVFHTDDPEISNLWTNNFDYLVPCDLYSANCKGINYDSFHDYPVSIEGLRKAGLLSEFSGYNAANRQEFTASNYREYMIRRVGPRIEEEYFRRYPQKLWGMPTSEMRADWAPKRIQIRSSIEPFFNGQFCATSSYGSGRVYQDIAEKIRKKGGNIYTGSEVTSIGLADNCINSLYVNGNEISIGDNTSVISCIPKLKMANLLGISEQLRYRGVFIGSYVSKFSSLPHEYDWVYIDDPDIIFTRITNYGTMSPHACNGFNVLMLEAPFASEDLIDRSSFERLFHESILKVPWLRDSELTHVHSQVERFVYPIREEGYEKKLSIVDSLLGRFHNLYCCGTSSEYEYGDVQICFRKSLDFANDFLDGLLDKRSSLCVLASPIDIPQFEFSKPLIIGEIGINHNGDFDMARRLLTGCRDAGIDFAKFQLYNPSKRANKYARDAFYRESSDGEGENMYDMFERCALSTTQYAELKELGDKLGIHVFFSAFDGESVVAAKRISPDIIKISSMDLTNFDVLSAARSNFNSIIMSTGMSTISDIEMSSSFLRSSCRDLTLLHCISSYPLNVTDLHLGTMRSLAPFADKIGYSDHSQEIFTVLLAVVYGATVLEKHITLDKSLPGPDHVHSWDLSELRQAVYLLSNLNSIFGVRTGVLPSEQREMLRQKKGFYYKTDLNAGSNVSLADLLLQAPCRGSNTVEIMTKTSLILEVSVFSGQPVNCDDFI